MIASHRADLSSVRIHYVEAGKADAPGLFLLHGWPQTWREWDAIIPTLAERFHVIAPNLRGLGDSSRPVDGYDARSVARDIVELADRLSWRHFHLVGHDLGALAAFSLAAHWRDRVSKLAILDVVLPGFGLDALVRLDENGWGIWHFPFHASPVAEFLVQGREREYMSYFFRNMAYAPDAIPPEHVTVFAEAYARPGAMRAGFAYYRAFHETGLQNQVAASEKLSIPVLAIGGSASVGPLVAEEMRKVAVNIDGAIAPESGHWIPEEQPDWLSERLLNFFD